MRSNNRMHLTGYSGLARFRRQVMRSVSSPLKKAAHDRRQPARSRTM